MALEKADLVLHEGAILGRPASDSIAIAEGRIVAEGQFSDLKTLVGPRTHLVRLFGRTVAPGFIDSHLHFLEAASVFAGAQVSRERTLSEMLLELRANAARTAPGNWLKAFGCDEALLFERRGPTRRELDEAVPKNPLRLRHQTLHASWLNSRAITLLGLERPEFEPPDGAEILRDANGQLRGLVVGMEEWLSARLPRVTAADLEARARIFSRELAAHGITAFTDASVRNSIDEFRLFAKLVQGRGLLQRTSLMLGDAHAGEAAGARLAGAAGGIAIAGAKFMGVAARDPREVARSMVRALREELDCAFHVTEVEELEAALAAIEAVQRHLGADTPPLAQAMRIEHGGVIPSDCVERLAACGAWVVTNPGFIYYRGVKYAAEPGLAPFLYRAKSLMKAGVSLAAGTDAPVTPARPLAAISAAVARTSLEGDEIGASERLSIAQAFDLFTASAAQLARLECGVIAAGALADLIVLARDPLKLSPAELMNLHVDLTIIDGRIVYERGRPEVAAGIPGN